MKYLKMVIMKVSIQTLLIMSSDQKLPELILLIHLSDFKARCKKKEGPSLTHSPAHPSIKLPGKTFYWHLLCLHGCLAGGERTGWRRTHHCQDRLYYLQPVGSGLRSGATNNGHRVRYTFFAQFFFFTHSWSIMVPMVRGGGHPHTYNAHPNLMTPVIWSTTFSW